VRIIKYPHPILRHKSKPLRRVDAELKKIVAEMFDLMYEDRGIGLAANQVGLPYRLVVMNLESDPKAKDQEFVLINPVISKRRGTVEHEEGCLSVPEIYAPVRRSEKIVLSAYDLAGNDLHYDLSGMFARAVQHEVDHVDGVLFIDRLTETNRLAIRDALAELELEFEREREAGRLPGDEQIAERLRELEALRA
jgi:peptide deformylase